MKCANEACQRSFTPRRKGQLYCCRACQRYAYKHQERKRRIPEAGELPIREFTCRKCGKAVFVYDTDDKRTDFCTRHCEKLYWKHKYLHGRETANKGMSGGMSLSSLIRRERRTIL